MVSEKHQGMWHWLLQRPQTRVHHHCHAQGHQSRPLPLCCCLSLYFLISASLKATCLPLPFYIWPPLCHIWQSNLHHHLFSLLHHLFFLDHNRWNSKQFVDSIHLGQYLPPCRIINAFDHLTISSADQHNNWRTKNSIHQMDMRGQREKLHLRMQWEKESDTCLWKSCLPSIYYRKCDPSSPSGDGLVGWSVCLS